MKSLPSQLAELDSRSPAVEFFTIREAQEYLEKRAALGWLGSRSIHGRLIKAKKSA
jgi:hypothetical protein